MSSFPWSAIELLIIRALGLSAPAGVDTPSAYAAGARRSRSLPVLPQAEFVRLLPLPSMERKPTAEVVSAGVVESVPACNRYRASSGSRLPDRTKHRISINLRSPLLDLIVRAE